MDKVIMFNDTLSHVKLVAAALVREMHPGRDELTQRQAWEEFGRTRIEQWIAQGLLKPRRVGEAKNAKRMYSRLELLTAVEVEQKMLNDMTKVK
jgi:hypothetical protein